MFMFSYCMTYVVHMGHYNAYTFTLVSSMCGHVLFTFDMYFIEVSNRVNSSLSFLLITKIRSFINQQYLTSCHNSKILKAFKQV